MDIVPELTFYNYYNNKRLLYSMWKITGSKDKLKSLCSGLHKVSAQYVSTETNTPSGPFASLKYGILERLIWETGSWITGLENYASAIVCLVFASEFLNSSDLLFVLAKLKNCFASS